MLPEKKTPRDAMTDLTRPIAESLRVTDFFMAFLTGDLSNEQATQRARGDAGPSISWVVGHLLNGRCEILKLLDPEAENPFAEKFDRLVAASDGSDYPPLADFLSSWSDVSQQVFGALSTVTHEQIVNPIAEMGAPHEEKNLLGVLVYVVWHETYHMGQIGTIRTQMGLTPMIDRAIEVWQASS